MVSGDGLQKKLLGPVSRRTVSLIALSSLLDPPVLLLAQPGDGRHAAPRRVDQGLGLAARHLPGGIAGAGEIPAPTLDDPAKLGSERRQEVGARAVINALGALHQVVEQHVGVLPGLLFELVSVSHD